MNLKEKIEFFDKTSNFYKFSKNQTPPSTNKHGDVFHGTFKQILRAL